MSTPERPDRGGAPREHRPWCDWSKESPGFCVEGLPCICSRRSGKQRRGTRKPKNSSLLRTWSRVGPTDRRRSPEDAGTFAQRATRHAWKYALGEDVRGADVGEARERLLDILADVCMNVHVHDYEALPGGIDLGKHADRILAALRSPEPARFTEADWKRALEWRGLTPDEVCGDCMGTGRKAYGSTATWRRGAYGGSSITEDVCDRCWGTGSQARTGADLRELSAIARSPEPAAEPVEALEIAWGIIANAYGGNWDLATEEWREAAIRWRDEHWHPRLPTAEPVAWGVWENSRFQFADHKEIAARAMAEDIRGFPDCRGEVEVRALYAHPPSAEPATGRDRSQGVTEQELASAGGEPRYTLDEVADMLDANVHSVKPGWMNAALWLRHEGTCGGPVYRRPDTLAEVADLIERREYGPGIGEEGLAIARGLRSGGATTETGESE